MILLKLSDWGDCDDEDDGDFNQTDGNLLVHKVEYMYHTHWYVMLSLLYGVGWHA